jgi:hypothetical protein
MDLAGQQFELNVAQGLDPREVLAEIPYGNERRHGANGSLLPRVSTLWLGKAVCKRDSPTLVGMEMSGVMARNDLEAPASSSRFSRTWRARDGSAPTSPGDWRRAARKFALTVPAPPANMSLRSPAFVNRNFAALPEVDRLKIRPSFIAVSAAADFPIATIQRGVFKRIGRPAAVSNISCQPPSRSCVRQADGDR